MSATNNSTNNARRDSRPSLSQQIDRLDHILDGLAEAIPAAVADSIKDSVTIAVAEAVRATVLEIASNPGLIAQLRPAEAPQPAEASNGRRSVTGRIGRFVSGAWGLLVGKCRSVTSAVAGTASQISGAVGHVNRVWNLRTPILVALGVGAVFGLGVAHSAPWFAGVLSGISAAAATLGAQFAAFARRIYARFMMA